MTKETAHFEAITFFLKKEGVNISIKRKKKENIRSIPGAVLLQSLFS